MTFLRINPSFSLSELLLKRHKTIFKVKLEDLKEIKTIPTKLKLIEGELKNESTEQNEAAGKTSKCD